MGRFALSGLALLVALVLPVAAADAHGTGPSPWIEIAPGKRLSVLLEASLRTDRTADVRTLAQRIDRLARSIRPRLGDTMVDLYPVRRLPLHLSGGARAITRRDFLSNVETSADLGLFYDELPDVPIAPFDPSLRLTPAATMGYQRVIAGRLLVGVEGGVMLGRTPLHRDPGATLLLLPGQFSDDGDLMLDPLVALHVSLAL